MISRRAPGVRTQFVLMAVLTLVTTGVVTLVYVPQYQTALLGEQHERRLKDMSALVSAQCAVAMQHGDRVSLHEVLDRLGNDSAIEGAQVFDGDGGVVHSVGSGLQIKVKPGLLEHDENYVVRNHQSAVFVMPIEVGGQRHGTLLVLTNSGSAASRIAEERQFLIGILAISIICGVFVALAFGSLLARRISRLRLAAERVANGDFDLRIPVHAEDEIGDLTSVFNRMVDQLKRTTISRDALSHEVQERRRAYERIRLLKEKAEEAARVKSEFLANMSHEIRTPMNGVIGMADLALDTDLTDEQRDYLNMCRLSAESLLAIIDDILDFSKIEAGKLSLDPVETDLIELVGVTLRTMAVKCNAKDLALIGSIAPEVPQRIVIDPTRLRQVIVNLVGNAIKFTDAGEIVTSVNVESLDGCHAVLHFSVRDTGIGIAEERRLTIFDAFSQADGSTTRRYGGTGLGLSISTQLVDFMGGVMWVDSEIGVGSTFNFTVECLLPEETHDDLATTRLILGRRVALIVENETERSVLARTLRFWGMKVETYDQPAAALEQFRDSVSQPELTIVDYQMRDQDGLEFVSLLSQQTDYQGQFALLKSSGSLQFVGANSSQFGIVATLNKPILPDDLRGLLVKAFGPELHPCEDTSRPAKVDALESTRVLLAEDNPVNRKLAVRVLEKRGHVVTAVPDGARAYELAVTGSFDLVLMDVQMPKMGGLEATRAIREHERNFGGHLPIVAMTANTYDDDRRSCLRAGMDGYVGKPVKPSVLFDEIERVLAAVHES